MPLEKRRKLLEDAEKDLAEIGDREYALTKNPLLKILDQGPARLAYLTELALQRKQQAKDFSQAINDLSTHLLKNSAIAKEFFHALDALRQAGIKLMSKRHGDGSNYHQIYHAIQVSYDAMREVESALGAGKTAQDKMTHLIILALTGAAAAWHDVAQKRAVKTLNEVVSADEFCDQLQAAFANQDDFIAAISTYRILIAEELIVDATFLDYQKDANGHINAKPVGMRIDEELYKTNHDPLSPFEMLLLAKKSIALVDASSASAVHVLNDQVIFRSLTKEEQAEINHFLTAPEMQDLKINPESFLQSIGQSMRMLLESAHKPDGNDYEQAILKNRPNCTMSDNNGFSYHDAFKNFLKARVLEAEDKFSIYMSNGDPDSVWQEQRYCLSALQKYLVRITPEKFEKLARAIFVSVAHERGTDKTIQSIVMGNTITTLYQHPNQSIKKLTLYQNKE